MPDTTLSWSAKTWLQDFSFAVQFNDYASLHRLRINVYDHTCACVRNGKYRTENGNEVTLSLDPHIGEETHYYREELPLVRKAQFEHTLIRAVSEDCLVTAANIRATGEEVCVLNMASRRTPGGGVLKGCGAQEEYLFRCSDYYRSLYRYSYLADDFGVERASDRYPMDRDFGGIFSRNVTVFRGSEKAGYPLLEKPWQANFIAVAALNRPDIERVNEVARLTPPMINATKNKIRTMLRIAIVNNQPNLVLGAFGCGAFRNPPAHMAELFNETLEEKEFQGAFKRVFFSIIEDHNSRGEGNFLPFARVFNQPAGEHISHLNENEVFVFGSNLAGHHAGGAARVAEKHFGAIWGQGVGLQGQSYAIPTMHGGVELIAPHVDDFTQFAAEHPEISFLVTRIGCGIAGFRDEEIAPLFARAASLDNVHLPQSFQAHIPSLSLIINS